MDLRDLKREIEKLPHLGETVRAFRQHWLKPYQKDQPTKHSFLKNLDPKTRKELNQRLALLKEHLDCLESSQVIHEKFGHQARMLIDAKLSMFNNDSKKTKQLLQRLVHDDLLSVGLTIKDIRAFDASLQKISDEYEEINELLDRKLSLEEALFYMDLPHRIYLNTMLQTAQKHKAITRDIGRHMAALTTEASLKKVPPR